MQCSHHLKDVSKSMGECGRDGIYTRCVCLWEPVPYKTDTLLGWPAYQTQVTLMDIWTVSQQAPRLEARLSLFQNSGWVVSG